MDNVHVAGSQPAMNRGTYQARQLDALEGDFISDFITNALVFAAGCGGQVINHFLNCNKGDTDGRWHRDTPSEEWRNTGRFILYYTLNGRRACLRVKWGDAEVAVWVPSGCAIYATNELLNYMHAHGAAGRCISYVIEVARQNMPTSHTLAMIAAAAAKQPDIPLLQYFGDWDPKMFRGAASRLGIGGGSVRRLVMSALRGPKHLQRRGT